MAAAAGSDNGGADGPPVAPLAEQLFRQAYDRFLVDLDIDPATARAGFDATRDPELRSAYAAVIATLHRQDQRYDAAEKWFDIAIEEAPPRTWTHGFSLALLAGLRYWQGRLRDASELVTEAEGYMPNRLAHMVLLQHCFIDIVWGRLDDAERRAIEVRQLALRHDDEQRWAIARIIEGRVQHRQLRFAEAEATYRSVLLRRDFPERVILWTTAQLALALAHSGAMNASIMRFEQVRSRSGAWPRGEMERGPAFATAYLHANLLELAEQTAEQTLEAATRLQDSVVRASALLVLARVDIARRNPDSARVRLVEAQSMQLEQDRPQLDHAAQRLLRALDPAGPQTDLTAEDFRADPYDVHALLAMASSNPEGPERWWAAAAGGIDVKDVTVRALARFATASLELRAGRLEAARHQTALLLETLRRRTNGVDALDARAAGFELVDLRGLAVDFARAGSHRDFFWILDAKERVIFDIGLLEKRISQTRSALETLRRESVESLGERINADELSDLDHRIEELRRARPAQRRPPQPNILPLTTLPTPQLAFTTSNGIVHRVAFAPHSSEFTEICSSDQLLSTIRRLRFAVVASGLDPAGRHRIELAGQALQDLLFRGLDVETDQIYSIRPGHQLVAVPWRFLPLGRRRQLNLRIATDAADHRPSSSQRRALVVACSGDPHTGLPRTAAEEEASAVAGLYNDATLLLGSEATPDQFAAASSDHDIIHIAGYQALVRRERLVTTIRLDGGPLTLYDIGQIESIAPIVVVASSQITPVRSVAHDVNLALAQTLISRGALEVVVSPIDLVPEVARVVLPALHAHLAAGSTASEALERLRFDNPEWQRAADCLVCIEADLATTTDDR